MTLQAQEAGLLADVLMLAMLPVVFGKVSLDQTSKTATPQSSGPSPEILYAMQILTTFIAPILFGVIIVVGLLGNCLVIIVILRNGHMRNSTNILIGSLAMADLTFIVFCIPLTMGIYVTRGWCWGEFLCRTYQYFPRLTSLCSVYSLVMMSFDRYLAVVHPIESAQWRTKGKTIAAVGTLWSLFIIANLPIFLQSGIVFTPFQNGSQNLSARRYYCTYKRLVFFDHSLDGYVDNFNAMGYFNSIFFLFAFLIPLSLIIVLYGLLLCRISQRLRNHHSTNITRSNKKVTRLVVIVIIAFALSWLPIHLVFIIQTIFGDPKSLSFRTFHLVANSMAYSNSMINPILYAFLSDNFRSAFKCFLRCNMRICDRCCKKKGVDKYGIELRTREDKDLTCQITECTHGNNRSNSYVTC